MERALRALLAGETDAAGAMRALRDAYSTPCTVASKTTLLRDAFREQRPRDARTLAALTTTREERIACKRTSRDNLTRRNARVRVLDGDALLSACRRVLASPAEHGPYDVALALLAVSGRRSAEILNGRSTFARVPGCKHAARFAGQLKTRGDAAPYRIPLLVPYAAFAAGLRWLRAEQKRDVATLSAAAVSRRYQSELSKRVHGREAASAFASLGLPNVHALRRVYVVLAHRFTRWDDARRPSLAYAAMRFLGHARIGVSLAYTDIEVRTSSSSAPRLECELW